MDKVKLCEKILKSLNSADINVQVLDNFKGNYYSYINKTIYLNKESATSIDEKVKQLVVISHEAYHTTQSRVQHILNGILSNLEIVYIVILAFIYIFSKLTFLQVLIYVMICLSSIVTRIQLEIPAITNSFKISKNFCDVDEIKVLDKLKLKAKIMMPLGVLSFSWFRLLRLVLVLIVFSFI